MVLFLILLNLWSVSGSDNSKKYVRKTVCLNKRPYYTYCMESVQAFEIRPTTFHKKPYKID